MTSIARESMEAFSSLTVGQLISVVSGLMVVVTLCIF